MKKHFGMIAAAVFALTLTAHAQMPTLSDVSGSAAVPFAGPLPKWDAAVVKPHPAEDHNMSWQMTGDSVRLVNLSLGDMLCSAWDVKPYQLVGLTGWMESARFDLTAKVSSDDAEAYKKLNIAQRREMLQSLLIERFQLKVHTESKTLPIYNLVIDKSGSKLKLTTSIEAPSNEERNANPEKYTRGQMTMGPGRYEATGVAIRSLASQLSNALSKPVHDATGLTGLYDIKLRFRPEDTAVDGGDEPSVFSAVQDQLGLKLVPGKGPVETLVVDAAQKPEEN